MPAVKKLSTALSLPTQLNEPPENLTDYCAMVYGRKQWGKTTLSSQYPNSYNFQFEPGRRGLRIFQVAPKSYSEAIEYIGLFLDSEYDYAIFDTVDRFYDMLLREECLELSNGDKDHPGKFGKEGYSIWDYVKNKFEQIFIDLRSADKKFILVSHDKKVEQKDRDGAEWSRIEPTCKPAAWKIAQSMCDFVFHCDFLGGDRIITVRDLDNSTLASCNPDIDCFLDPNGEPLRRFKIPNQKDGAFSALQAAFDNELFDYDYEPPKKPLPTKGKRSLAELAKA
jgi:hypothetical protein